MALFQLRGMDASTLVRAWRAGRRAVPVPTHVFLCIADHFEPDWNAADRDTQFSRIDRWVNGFPVLANESGDSRGRPPQHTFFYPIETYDPVYVDRLMPLIRDGYGDVEVHLHHDNDTAESLRERLLRSVQQLHDRHGLFSRDEKGMLRYGFIHGNWALDNSHPDGCWCGVNNELTVLMQTGCYADFTMPAAPHAAQTRTINQVYYAVDDPQRPKSHDTGVQAQVGCTPPADSLLMIQGPLLLSHSNRGWRPSIENGNLIPTQPPDPSRLDDWLRAGVGVSGQSDWVFIKLHTHGAKPGNTDMLLGESMMRFHEALRSTADRRGFKYFYVTAKEMAQLVHQAERRFESPDFNALDWPAFE
ncbi:MAG: hypothetical protein AAGG48_14815 [Planctomycetota bacterium]